MRFVPLKVVLSINGPKAGLGLSGVGLVTVSSVIFGGCGDDLGGGVGAGVDVTLGVGSGVDSSSGVGVAPDRAGDIVGVVA